MRLSSVPPRPTDAIDAGGQVPRFYVDENFSSPVAVIVHG